MRNGISFGTLPTGLPFGEQITSACALSPSFSALLAYAIKWNETSNMDDAASVISGDGGHGLFQLTASYPIDWTDPFRNAVYAIDEFLLPAETYWATEFQGDDLVRAIAAEFNAGRGQAIAGHEKGNLDLYTTNDYAARALATYTKLCAGLTP
jgi:hypothetical protein